MSEERTIHRYSLVDSTGKTRLTCNALGRWRARLEFKRMRNGRSIVEGWTIVDRGPVEDIPDQIDRKREAEHLDFFRVGDRVQEVTMFGPKGRVGTVGNIKENFAITVIFDDDPDKYPWGYHQGTGSLKLVEKRGSTKLDVVFTISDLPQVEAILTEARETIQSQAEAIRTLTEERDLAREREANSRMEADIAYNSKNTLLSTVKKLEKERDDLKVDCEVWRCRFSPLTERVNDAESKLDDLAAVIRTGRIMDAAEMEDPSLIDAMESVLSRSGVPK